MKEVEYDEAKRALTLQERGLDFARAAEVFEGVTMTLADTRQAYGEPRFNSLGFLDGRLVVVTWTWRNSVRRIISMRKANEREQARFNPLDGS